MPAEYEVPDQLKNDFQNAKKRNLHTWTQWRTKLNHSIVDAVLSGSDLQNIESFGRYMNHEVPDPDHPTTNPKTLMTYSAAENSSTNLRRSDFYKYGIPRVKLSPAKETIGRKSVDVTNRSEYNISTPERDFGLRMPRTQPDGVTLDYFGYEEPSERRRSIRSSSRPADNLYLEPEISDYDPRGLSRDHNDRHQIHRLNRHHISMPLIC